MVIRDRIGDMFLELCAQHTPEARRLYCIQHPIVAVEANIDELAAQVAAGKLDVAEPTARAAIAELRAFVAEISPGPRSHPIGQGPIELIWDQVLEGRLRMDHGRALAAASATADMLSERYAHAIGFHCAVLANQGDYRGAQVRHQLLLAAARACRNPVARAVRIRAEREWLVTACAVLMHIAAGPSYKDALAGGQWLLETLDERSERALLGETLHYLGMLNLDPYAAYRSPENHELEHRMWLTRTVEEFGHDFIDGIPTPSEALARAEQYLRRAIEVAVGDYAGHARKALLQTLKWREILGDRPATDRSELLAETLAVLDPLQDPGRWLRIASGLASAGGKMDERQVSAVLSQSLDDWRRRLGDRATAEMLPALLDLHRAHDPWIGLALAVDARELVAEQSLEQQRIAILRGELNLFGAIAERQGVDPSDRESAVRFSSGAGVRPEVAAACLVALAANTSASDGEALGLKLLDQAAEVAPPLAQRHARVLAFLRSELWLGLASNAVKAVPPRIAEAVASYGNALGLDLDIGLLDRGLEMLARIENLSRRHDLDSAIHVLAVLLGVSLRAQLAIGEPAETIIRRTCRQLTIACTGNAELLPIVWQVAKGERWAATLAEGVAAPSRDASVRRLLGEIAKARRELPPGTEEQPITSGSVFFEAWLTSYVRTERYDGDQDWERLANLKMTLDGHIADLPASVSPARRVPNDLEKLQGGLAADAALLIVYVGEYDERAAIYSVLITRESITAQARVPSFQGNEYSLTQGERTTILSAVGAEVSAMRNAIAGDPPFGQVVSTNGAESLARALPLFFGELAQELATLRREGKSHLIVAPADALHFAPFHLFGTNGSPLADEWTVTYLPNIALLDRIAQRQQQRGSVGASVGLGFANGDGGWPAIEEAVTEASEVAAVLGVDPLLNDRATKPAVIDALLHANRLHIATHGALDVDAPALQFLALHPAHDAGSRLCAHEILDLDLRHVDIVTLSACETALGRVDRSDNLRGLPAALFTAGVSTVVGTLWPVESRASRTFFSAFHRALCKGRTRLEAFRAAQTETRSSFVQYRDWGPFYLAGDWT